jgi:cell division inhibitor SulA
MQSDLLDQSAAAVAQNPFDGLIEKVQRGTVTELTLLSGNEFYTHLNAFITTISQLEADQWLSVIGPQALIEKLASSSANKPKNLLLLPSKDNNQAFSLAQKVMTGGQSSWVLVFMAVESHGQQLALQAAARKGNTIGLILKTH